ncbi:abasic site processing protein HMCES [Diprion similis]|uniref:abasic site processing protein HMCES n=1 Tax=Diprion similis TaxID=362088 RepID=UPI001EF8BD1F|nr:abasic site processing protein HMCES [Diprion similis]
MCGRTACTLEPEAMCKACQYKDSAGKHASARWQAEETGDGRGYCSSYNLAPTDVIPCVVAGRHFRAEEERVLHPMVWGMIPRWHKGDYRKHGMSTHNARFEGLSASKLYSHPLSLGQRCVIVCDGYYEWKTTKQTSKGSKQPYFIYAKQDEGVKIEDRQTWNKEWSQDDGWNGIKLLKIAGIFDTWLSAENKKIYSCSMITTSANEILSWLHHRIPMFLESDEEVADWLDYENVPLRDALKKLHGPTTDSLKWHPVDPMVNNSRFKSISCYQPIVIEEKKEKVLQSGLMTSWLKTGSMKSVKNKSEIDAFDDKSDIKRLKSE